MARLLPPLDRNHDQLRQTGRNAARGDDPADRRERTCRDPRPRSEWPRFRRAAESRRPRCPPKRAVEEEDRPAVRGDVRHERRARATRNRSDAPSPRFRSRSVSSALATNRQPSSETSCRRKKSAKEWTMRARPFAIHAPERGRVDVRAARGVPDLARARVPTQPDAALEHGRESAAARSVDRGDPDLPRIIGAGGVMDERDLRFVRRNGDVGDRPGGSKKRTQQLARRIPHLEDALAGPLPGRRRRIAPSSPSRPSPSSRGRAAPCRPGPATTPAFRSSSDVGRDRPS